MAGLFADCLVAGLAGALVAAACGPLFQFADRWTGGVSAAGYRRFLLDGGWLRLPLAFAAAGAIRTIREARSRPVRTAAALVAIVLSAASLLVQIVPAAKLDPAPRGAAAKARAMRRWSFDSPGAVLKIVAMSRDRDPGVRELAMLAMGENVVVSAFERPSPAARPDFRVRDSLLAELERGLVLDRQESVRGEAARALWRAPRTFGERPAAADTLAALLDRAGRPDALERLSWLALDAAAGHFHPALAAAVERFAVATPDSELARAARVAIDRSGRPASRSDMNEP